MSANVTAIVVTYNRKVLLCECIEAILHQTHPVSRLIIVNNASTDGTLDVLKEKGCTDNPIIKIITLEKNVGGAGGFYAGMKASREEDAERAVWIMDDDTIPTADCLKGLVDAANKLKGEYSYLASSVYGPNGECMNVPSVDGRATESGYPGWYCHLQDGLVKITEATFVSLLISAETLKHCGLPCRDYFIWGDDTEYTTRVTTFFKPAYMVGASVAIHKRAVSKALDFVHETNKTRIAFQYYQVRNAIVGLKYYRSRRDCQRYAYQQTKLAMRLLFSGAFSKACIVFRGLVDGVREYPRFKQFIDTELGV